MKQDRNIRKNTYVSVNEKLKEKSEMSAFYLNSHFKFQNLIAKNEGYTDLFDKILNYSNMEISKKELMDSLIEVQNLYQFLIKKKMTYLGLQEISFFDLYLISEKEEKVSIKLAQKVVLEALKPLGEDYLIIVKKCFSENWIDWHLSPSKKPGG